MKNALLAALAAFLLLIPTTSLAQSRDLEGWSSLGKADNGYETFLRDEDWVKGRPHMRSVKVWERTFAPKPVGKYVGYTALVEYNCVEGTYRDLTTTFYTIHGTSETKPGPTSWKYAIPGTTGGLALDTVCSDVTDEGSATPSTWES